MVKGEYSSYKDLPVMLYQVQTKYRDEARPRAGILRGREFVMKDSYSFDLDDEGLQRSYDLHREAYVRIFERLGMDVPDRLGRQRRDGRQRVGGVPRARPHRRGHVRAVHLVRLRREHRGRRAARGRAPRPRTRSPRSQVLDTPGHPDDRDPGQAARPSSATRSPPSATLKNVVVLAPLPDGRTRRWWSACPATAEVDVKRLEANVTPAEVLPFDAFDSTPSLVKGYIGPQGLEGCATSSTRSSCAAAPGRRGPTSRASTPSTSSWAATSSPPPSCPRRGPRRRPLRRCGSPLEIGRGIEIGHIFQLGRKYADAFGLDVLGPDSKPVRVTMGSYGIGVSRAIAAIAEQSYDEKGWPGRGRSRRRTCTSSASASRTSPRSPSGSPPSSRAAA
jgi:prolyl-tRNA synthetase